MSAARQLVLTGSDATRAADKLRKLNERRAAWPYVYVSPPPESINVLAIGNVLVPTAGSTVTVATFTVPNGFRFIFRSIINVTNAAFTPGDSTWSVIVNPNNGFQANPIHGLVNVPVQLGSFQSLEFRFERAFEFSGNDLISVLATNVNLGDGVPNYYTSAIMGYRIPV